MSEPAHIKPILLVWNARVVLVDICPVSEIDVCSIEAGPLFSCNEMLFQLFGHITLQQGSEKILVITRIRKDDTFHLYRTMVECMRTGWIFIKHARFFEKYVEPGRRNSSAMFWRQCRSETTLIKSESFHHASLVA